MGLARTIGRVFNLPFLDGIGGFQQGEVAVFASTPDYTALLPTGAQPYLQPVAGINRTAGVVAGAGTSSGEELSLQQLGLAAFQIANGTVVAAGQQVICDPANLGATKPRSQWSFSAQILGWFTQALTGTTDPLSLAEGVVNPYWVEIVRSFAGYVATAPAAGQTKYANGPSGAVANSAVPLMPVPFTGNVARNLTIGVTTAPAAGETLTATLYRNPLVSGAYTGFVATTLTCAISGTGLVAFDQTHAVPCNQGDLLALQFVASNNGSYAAAGLSYGFDLT